MILIQETMHRFVPAVVEIAVGLIADSQDDLTDLAFVLILIRNSGRSLD